MKYIFVGKIIGTHGIKGEVKVKSDTNFKNERYKKNNILYLDYKNEKIDIKINSHRIHKNLDLITFNDITNINDVLQYVNCDIYVDKESLSDLGENEFYYDDLVGLNVVDQQGINIGIVIDINEVPQGEIIVVKKPDESQTLIPFIDEFIKEVDLKKKIIIISPIEGLI